MFGLGGAVLGLPRDVTLHALAHCAVRDAISAAVRLNVVGPLKGVELQAAVMRDLRPELEDAASFACTAAGAAVDFDEVERLVGRAASAAPLAECAHSAHDLLEARLFVT